MKREPEPEYMDLEDEAIAYAEADFEEVNTAFVDDLLAEAGPAEEWRVLDLGCGPADITRRLQEARPGWHVTGLDASWPMLRVGRGTNGKLPLVFADAASLPFPDGSFDAVISNSILHHVADPLAFWRSSAAAAKQEALIFLRDLIRPASEEAAQDLVDLHATNESPLLREEFFRSLLAAYTLGEVRHQLKAAGLHGLTVRAVTDRHLDVVGRIGI